MGTRLAGRPTETPPLLVAMACRASHGLHCHGDIIRLDTTTATTQYYYYMDTFTCTYPCLSVPLCTPTLDTDTRLPVYIYMHHVRSSTASAAPVRLGRPCKGPTTSQAVGVKPPHIQLSSRHLASPEGKEREKAPSITHTCTVSGCPGPWRGLPTCRTIIST